MTDLYKGDAVRPLNESINRPLFPSLGGLDMHRLQMGMDHFQISDLTMSS